MVSLDITFGHLSIFSTIKILKVPWDNMVSLDIILATPSLPSS
jgi:hypothetical protein